MHTLKPPRKFENHPSPRFLHGIFGIFVVWTSGLMHVSPPIFYKEII